MGQKVSIVLKNKKKYQTNYVGYFWPQKNLLGESELIKFLDEMEFNRIKSLVISKFGDTKNDGSNVKPVTKNKYKFDP